MPTATSNPLLEDWNSPHGLPPFAVLQPGLFEPAFAAALKEHRAEIDSIAGNPQPPHFDNTVAALDRSGRLLDRIESLFYNLASSETSAALQAVQMRMAPVLAAHSSAINMHAALFKRIDALYEARDVLGLTQEQLRVIERFHSDFVRAGARLGPEQQKRYAEIMCAARP